MVTHHHPSSWLVKEEEEESSEPKTWASQARCAKIGRSQGFQGGNRKRIYWRAFKRLCTYIWSAPPPERIYIYINYICYIYYSILCTMYHVLCTISVFALCIISYIYIIMYSIYYLYIIYIYIYVLRVSSNDFTISDFPIYRQILLTHSGAMRCAWQMWLGCFAAWTKRFLPWKTTRIIWKDSTICLFLL